MRLLAISTGVAQIGTYQWTSLGDVLIYNPQSLNINTLNALHAGLRQSLVCTKYY